VATYVLVHGAWGGSYGFRSVRRILNAAGHEALTPSLTGLGERSHLTGPHVDLSVHVRDVVNVLHYDDLEDVVLLGFSYGGMVVTGALEQVADRVRELVYLDAFVPDDGDSVRSLTGGELGDDSPDAPPTVPAGIRTFDDPMVAARSNPRRHAQPMRTLTERVRVSVPVEQRGVGLTYVRATQDPNGAWFEPSAARARESTAWRYHEIATTHMVPENRPEELAELLQALA
jgi:pimeloyl-ACP methyl ester carboxylesterase